MLNLPDELDYVPYAYTYLAKTSLEADELVKKLKLKGINIYRYWTNMPDNRIEKFFYTNLVVIVLDYKNFLNISE